MGRGTLYALIMFFCVMTLLFFTAILFATLDDNWTIVFYPLIVSPLVAIFCWAMELQLDSGDERSWERSGCDRGWCRMGRKAWYVLIIFFAVTQDTFYHIKTRISRGF